VTALHVVFRVADAEYALPAADVLLMESYTGATRVPGAIDYVAGLVQVRGRVIPVIDLRVRFGLAPAPTTLDSRIVVVELDGRAVGLLVESAREVVKLGPEQIQAPPRALLEGAGGFVKAVAHLGPRMLMVVDFGKVIGEEPVDVN